MIRKTLTYLILPTIAAVSLMVWPAEALAQRGGHGGGGFHGGGFRGGGGFHGGGFHGGAVHYGYHPNYGGYHSYGYRPFYGYHNRPFYGYGLGYFPYYGYSYGYDPYYDQGYWTNPSAGYDSGVVTTDSVPASDPGPAQATATAPVAPAGGTASATGDGQGGSVSPSNLFSMNTPSHITVRLPADADLWFDGTKMSATGAVREFSTQTLTPNRQYTYKVRARWSENGTTTDQTRTVVFTAGNDVEVIFPVPSGTVGKANGTNAP